MPRYRLFAVISILLAGLTHLAGCTTVSPGQSLSREQAQPEAGENKPSRPGLSIDRHILDTQSQAFIPHVGNGKFESYVTQNIAFGPVEKLRAQIEHDRGIQLTHRGEAHITVVTPPEFERLSSHLSINEINRLVGNVIQQSKFEIVCLGMGELTQDHNALATYFLVVRSNELLQLRNTISRAYLRAGGTRPAFRSGFYPHVTIGFTQRDLYESDGVKKNADSCVESVKLK